MATSIDIIIVNWNSGEQLRKCLESIVFCNKDSYELNQIVVVDNASSDESMDKLNVFDLPLSVIANAENRGFAVACNQGARGSEADYLLFLNRRRLRGKKTCDGLNPAGESLSHTCRLSTEDSH